jgi:hypothetical protein
VLKHKYASGVGKLSKMLVLVVVMIVLFVSCRRQPPPPLETCQQQLVDAWEGGESISNAVRDFMDCAEFSVFDIINLLV